MTRICAIISAHWTAKASWSTSKYHTCLVFDHFQNPSE